MECESTQPPAPDAPSPAKQTPYDPAQVILYKRNRFQSRLPKARLYTKSHFWLEEIEPAADGKPPLYKVGFTRFATRMLGEIVEHGFEAKPGTAVKVGQAIGWVEGFKALSDVYCVLDGTFESGNPELDADPSRIDKDPYHAGWLYLARGTPEPNSLDVTGYISVLDATIDKMLG
ncbi:MAG TPA: glycine cleavage system protein H [Humisphaera sp.]